MDDVATVSVIVVIVVAIPAAKVSVDSIVARFCIDVLVTALTAPAVIAIGQRT